MILLAYVNQVRCLLLLLKISNCIAAYIFKCLQKSMVPALCCLDSPARILRCAAMLTSYSYVDSFFFGQTSEYVPPQNLHVQFIYSYINSCWAEIM